MKASFIEKDGNVAKFEIEFTAEEFENALIDAYKLNKDQFRVDGFRKGKAPRKLIMQHYGEQIFDEEALDGLLQKAYPNALIEMEIEPIDRPSLNVPELRHGEGFTVKIEVAQAPEIEVKDYEGVVVKAVEYTISDEDVDKQIEQAQTRGARILEVEREAQDGDTVDIDYVGSVDGVEFAGGADKGQDLVLGSGMFIPGFEEQIVGKKAGEEVTVSVTFPEEYHSEELAGKVAEFAVKINAVKTEEKPELNDEFAQDVSEFDTLDELKADIREKLTEQADKRAEFEVKDAILEKIFDANEVDVPEVMVDDQLEEMLKEFEREIKQQGMKLEQYFQMTKQVPAELREKIKGDAYKRVKMKLIVQNIARLQGFTATDEEVEAELNGMAEQYNMEKEKMREILGDFQVKLLKDDLINKKAVDYIYENAIVENE
ncbi:MAG: trigger factor [Clostridiales Family XIII bacterium]|jgi:trigger factor|nr:trigger factor [Clostridiales Family XIII bacterium]